MSNVAPNLFNFISSQIIIELRVLILIRTRTHTHTHSRLLPLPLFTLNSERLWDNHCGDAALERAAVDDAGAFSAKNGCESASTALMRSCGW